MSELGIVVMIVNVLVGFAAVATMPPIAFVYGIVGLLNAINVIVAYINIWQAWKNDLRFLHAGWLGLIGVLVGLALFGLFMVLSGWGMITLLASLPFIWGGIASIAAALLFGLVRRTRRHQQRDGHGDR